MKYIRLDINIPDDYHELLIAELFELDFIGFQQEEDLLVAAIEQHLWDEVKREALIHILQSYPVNSSIEKESIIESQNWNKLWEQSIKAQRIGPFLVKPSWSGDEPLDDEIELIIEPKMAFGTGYHSTTYLLLNWIPELVQKNFQVLDAGTGTGILVIAAAKLGAASCFGFDTDEWSKHNAEENAALNGVNMRCEFALGSTEVIPPNRKYDLILANINRNTIIELLPVLVESLKNKGSILLSGLLQSDENTILNQPILNSFNHKETRIRDEWIAMYLQR